VMPKYSACLKQALVLLAVLLSQGCGSTGAHLTGTVKQPLEYTVGSDEILCILETPDVSHHDDPNKGSGALFVKRVADAVTEAKRGSATRETLAECQAAGFSYALYPKLLTVDNRIAYFTANQDRISVKVTLYSLHPETELNGFFMTTRSSINDGIFFGIGDGNPQRLLDKDFDAAVADLLNGESTF
jgi:hypothetical protein